MNEYDSNRILDLTKKINYISTKKIEEADCYILNTCHIREKATDKVYHDIGRLKKEFRDKKKPIVLIAGCVAQAEGEVLRSLQGGQGDRDQAQPGGHHQQGHFPGAPNHCLQLLPSVRCLLCLAAGGPCGSGDVRPLDLRRA